MICDMSHVELGTIAVIMRVSSSRRRRRLQWLLRIVSIEGGYIPAIETVQLYRVGSEVVKELTFRLLSRF